MRDLNGRVAIVTGGGQGLGAATARALSKAGVTVVCADLNLEKAQEVARSLTDEGCLASALALNVSDENSVQAAVREVLKRYDRIDILINNAGTDKTVPFTELSVADWDRVVGTNLRGPFLMMKAVLPILYEQESGHVVNIASTAAKRAWANAAAYHASKWGLIGLSHALFVEAREHHVKVSALVVGGMQTPFILERFPDTPLANLQDPANVADAIVYLLGMPDETIIPEMMVIPMTETSWP